MSDDLTFGTNAAESTPAKSRPKSRAKPKKTAARPAKAEDTTDTPETAARPAGNEDMSRIFGQIVTLLGQSPSHRHVFISDLEWLVLPALAARQVRVWRRQTERGTIPVAYASWAMASPEVEARLVAGQLRLRPGDWRSGSAPWLIDLVAPYGGADAALQELADQIAPGGVLKTLVPNAGGGTAVREIHGKG